MVLLLGSATKISLKMFAKLNYILKISHKRVKFVLAKAHFAQPAGHKVAQISFLVVCEVKIGWYTQFWILVTMGTLKPTWMRVGGTLRFSRESFFSLSGLADKQCISPPIVQVQSCKCHLYSQDDISSQDSFERLAFSLAAVRRCWIHTICSISHTAIQ